MFVTSVPCNAVQDEEFSDVEKGSEIYGAVKFLKSSGVIEGVGDKKFAPDVAVSRADFAVIADKAFEFDSIGDISFSDVYDGDYFETSVKRIAGNGIIKGYNDGTFKPSQIINKQEASVILVKIYEKYVGKKIFAKNVAQDFDDYKDIDSWAKTYIDKAYFLGIINPLSDTEIGATEPFSRGDTALAVSKLILLLNDKQKPDFGAPNNIKQWQRGNIFVGNQTMGFTLETGNDAVEYVVTDYNNKIVEHNTVLINNGSADFVFENYKPGYYEVEFYCTDDEDIKHRIKKTSMCLLEDYDFDSIDPSESGFGINAHCDLSSRGWKYDLVDVMSIIGAKHVRDGYEWSSTEYPKGVYTRAKNTIQGYFDRLNSHNMSLIIVTGFTNQYYDHNATPYTDDGRAGFANWAKSFFDLYDGNMSLDMYNEFWGSQFGDRGDGPADGLPEYYIPLLKKTYETIKKDYPDSVLHFCVGHDDPEKPFFWRRRIFELGALNYCDIINLHRYGPNRTSGICAEDDIRGEFKLLRQDIADFAPDKLGKTIWNTETGGCTSTNKFGMSEETVAQHIPRIYAINVAEGVERVYFYDLLDDGNHDSDHEDRYGLMRAFGSSYGDYTPKPSFVSYGVIARQLTGLKLKANKSFENGIEWYTFEGDGKTVNMLNTRCLPDKEFNIDAAVYTNSEVVITDIMGDRKTYMPVEGKIYLTLSGDPIYVEGEIYDIREEKAFEIESDSYIPTGKPYSITISNAADHDFSNMKICVDDGEFEIGTGITMSPFNSDGKRKVVLELKNGDNLCGRFIKSVTAKKGYETDIDVRLQPGSEENIFDAILKLKLSNNAPYNLNVYGALINIDGTDTEYNIDEEIEANNEKTIEMNIGNAIFGTSHNIYARVNMDGELSESIDASGKFQYNAIEKRTIEIDGVLDEGIENERSLKLTENGERFELANDGSRYQGEEDLSGTVWVTYDDENIYISADIVDDEHSSAAEGVEIWRNDCVQVDFYQHETEGYNLVDGFTEVGVSLLQSGDVGLWCWKSVKAFENAGKPDGLVAAVTRDEKTKHTYYEIAVSWEKTGGIDINNISRIDLSLAFNDCDNGARQSAIEVGGGIVYGKAPEKYNRYSLIR